MSNDPALPGILSGLAPVLDKFGYAAVGGLLFLEDFGIPVPGETVLIAASVYAGAGRLNIAVIIVIGIVAAVLGDNVGYLIGRIGGRKLVLRWGRYVFLSPERLHRAEQFFRRHGGKIVAVARFIEGLRQANGIIAGISEMPWRRFLAFNVVGAVVWVGTWAGVGYLAGNHITAIYNTVSRYSLYALIGIVVVIAVLIVRHFRKKSRTRSTEADGNAAADGPAAE